MQAEPITDELVWATVHELRDSKAGIQHLQQTGRFREYMEQRRTERRSRAGEYSRRNDQRWFIAWDGEGWTDADLEHRYNYFACSEGDYVERPQLTSRECFDLLLSVGERNPDAIHIIYGGGYDATHWCRDMSLKHRTELMEEGRTTWRGYSLSYVPHKWFKISRGSVRVTVFDVMTFFQSSFIKALDSRALDIPEVIRSGKAGRATFTLSDMDTIRVYCRMELELLVMLADQLRDEFIEANISLRSWHGPGAVAGKVLRQRGVSHHQYVPPEHIERLVASAYYGGRFERFRAGTWKRKVYQYDIRSAYPDKIANLPSLREAEWLPRRARDIADLPRYGISRVSFSGFDKRLPCPLPWRSRNGSVGFPQSGTTTVWNAELHALSESERRNVRVDESWELILASDEKPFTWVAEMYDRRARWKADGKGGERALKLAMNSLYGKLAQQVGGRNGGRPTWHQLEWAGLITSETRAQLWGALRLSPKSAIAVETDAVFSTEPLSVPVGTGLGQWELTEYSGISYVQSGLYFTTVDGSTRVKSRGVNPSSVPWTDVSSWLQAPLTQPFLASTHRFIGLGNPRTSLYGQWIDEVREINISGGKRIHVSSECRACRRGVGSFLTAMHDMVVAPEMGIGDSAPFPIKWLGGDPSVFARDTDSSQLAYSDADLDSWL